MSSLRRSNMALLAASVPPPPPPPPPPQRSAPPSTASTAASSSSTASPRGSFSCFSCSPPRTFGSLPYLNRHIQQAHGPPEERTCPHCAQVLVLKSSLPRHINMCNKKKQGEQQQQQQKNHQLQASPAVAAADGATNPSSSSSPLVQLAVRPITTPQQNHEHGHKRKAKPQQQHVIMSSSSSSSSGGGGSDRSHHHDDRANNGSDEAEDDEDSDKEDYNHHHEIMVSAAAAADDGDDDSDDDDGAASEDDADGQQRPPSKKKRRRSSSSPGRQQQQQQQQHRHRRQLLQCPQCPKAYRQPKRLTEHIKLRHADVTQRTCPYCRTVLSHVGSVKRHMSSCKQRPSNRLICTIAPSNIAPRASDPRCKTRVNSLKLDVVEEYIGHLDQYLRRGNFIYTFVTKRSVLQKLTIDGYISSIRKYLQAIYLGLRPTRARNNMHRDNRSSDESVANTDEEKEEEDEEEKLSSDDDGDDGGEQSYVPTMQDMLIMSVQLGNLNAFLLSLHEDNFQARTIVNYMSAISWHLVYLKALTHPDLNVNAWSSSARALRAIFHPTQRHEQMRLEQQLTESYNHLRQTILNLSHRATQQTKARNSGEALRLRGRWTTFEWMTSLGAAFKEEGWGRMTCLQRLIALVGYPTLLQKRKADFDWLRNWVIFSFFTDMPPMRAQNLKLEVLSAVEPPGCRKTNALLFFKTRTCLQLVHFKNRRFAGEHIVELPQTLSDKLISYMRYIRPAYGGSETQEQHKAIQEAKEEKGLMMDDGTTDPMNESDSNKQACELNKMEAFLREHSATWLPGEELREEVHAWRAQSPWIILTKGNRKVEHLGRLWTQFIEAATGESITISVWRKIVETHSAATNTIEQQHVISHSLLHQHATGQDYYVSRDTSEHSRTTQLVWNDMTLDPELATEIERIMAEHDGTPQVQEVEIGEEHREEKQEVQQANEIKIGEKERTKEAAIIVIPEKTEVVETDEDLMEWIHEEQQLPATLW